jgi:hypothetical protein
MIKLHRLIAGRGGHEMKRMIAVLMIALIATCAYAQVNLNNFETAFKEFSTDMAGSLAVNSTIGANWSDAYVGNFPHLGIGLTMGATTVDASASKALFTSLNADVPSGINSIGIPIPAAVGTFKIGLPFVPMDIGFKLGFLPASVARSLMDSSGSDIKYMNYGLQLRYALVKQGPGLKPNVSVGLAYNHVDGELTVPAGKAQSYSIPVVNPSTGQDYYIAASAPKVDLSWKTNTVDVTAQVSKKFFILVPYLGTGLTFGKATIEGGVSSDITTDYPGADLDSKLAGFESIMRALGYDVPDINSHGFTYTAAENSPLFRLYGGMSFRIFIIDADLQAIYLPSSKSFGASLTGRIQF